MLMRYSALTFNGHRIHYDRPYAIEQEGYPGLVVHGPFIATLLLDHLKQSLPDAEVQSFEFKAVSPLFEVLSHWRSYRLLVYAELFFTTGMKRDAGNQRDAISN